MTFHNRIVCEHRVHCAFVRRNIYFCDRPKWNSNWHRHFWTSKISFCLHISIQKRADNFNKHNETQRPRCAHYFLQFGTHMCVVRIVGLGFWCDGSLYSFHTKIISFSFRWIIHKFTWKIEFNVCGDDYHLQSFPQRFLCVFMHIAIICSYHCEAATNIHSIYLRRFLWAFHWIVTIRNTKDNRT